MTFTRNLAIALATLIAAGSMTACNTIEGAGKDIKAGGTAIEREADKANK